MNKHGQNQELLLLLLILKLMVLKYLNKFKRVSINFCLIILFTSSLVAQEDNYLDTVIKRINNLENELKNIQSNENSFNKNTNKTSYTDAIANHQQRLVEIEEEIRVLNGALEELNYKVDNLLDELKKESATTDNENNLTNTTEETTTEMEKANQINENIILDEDPNIKNNPSMKVLGTVDNSKKTKDKEFSVNKNAKNVEEELPNKLSQQEEISDKDLSLLSKSPSEIYSYAYDMLIKENFMEAEKSFKAFLGEHPNDDLASNAYYWLGETYYVQKKFQLAAISFARGFQSFPKGNKALDQLFKLALTFINLGKNEDACAAFSKLESEFPDAPKRISNRAKEYMKRAKC